MLVQLMKDRRYEQSNRKFYEIVNYYLSKKDLATVKRILQNTGFYTDDSIVRGNVAKLFLNDARCVDLFGIAEDIVGTMSNVIFSGNIKMKVDNEQGQEHINKLYREGQLIDTLKEAYEVATATNGKSYVVMNLNSAYNATSGIKEKDLFIDFDVWKPFEIRVERLINENKNVYIREMSKVVKLENDKEAIWNFYYKYTVSDDKTILEVYGFTDKEEKISDKDVMRILDITSIYEEYNYRLVFEINIGKGMLPNILNIENKLAEAEYFKARDLPNSQTQTYTTENSLYGMGHKKDIVDTYDDIYETRHTLKADLEGEVQKTVKGESAITSIERNQVLTVMRACIDAKISPATLGYALLDRMGTNTDVGLQRERNTVRLRETHINKLKIAIPKILQEYLKLFGIEVSFEKITVVFDNYITPSIETQTNVLAKQVQFGLKSRQLASREINKDELSEEELAEEYERIKELATQIDYNVEQRGVDNKLKSSGVED